MNKILQHAIDEEWTLTDLSNNTLSIQDFIDKYGEKAATATVFAKQVGQETPKSRVGVRHPNKPKRKYNRRPERKTTITIQASKEENKEKKERYVPIYLKSLNNQEFRVKYRNKLTLYCFLRSTAARINPKADASTIQQRVYDHFNPKIAVSWSYPQLAKFFGYKGTTIIKQWIDELWSEGAFEIEHLNVGKPEPQNVYIIGEWIDGHDWYYFDLINNGSKNITITKMVST